MLNRSYKDPAFDLVLCTCSQSTSWFISSTSISVSNPRLEIKKVSVCWRICLRLNTYADELRWGSFAKRGWHGIFMETKINRKLSEKCYLGYYWKFDVNRRGIFEVTAVTHCPCSLVYLYYWGCNLDMNCNPVKRIHVTIHFSLLLTALCT
jgi:hypothetical protein